MKKEFNLKEERERWFSKWLQKNLTGRAIVELKNQDKEFVRLLKEINFYKRKHNILHSIDKLAGRVS